MPTKILNKIKHLVIPGWWARRVMPDAVCARIEAVIKASEVQHRGEIRFVAETCLYAGLGYGRTVRERAINVFSELRVWDTEENTGVLVYLQLVDRDFEIVADRGINARVVQDKWEAICQRMEAEFRAGRLEQGVLAGLEDITHLLTTHFPAHRVNPNELPDAPIVR